MKTQLVNVYTSQEVKGAITWGEMSLCTMADNEHTFTDNIVEPFRCLEKVLIGLEGVELTDLNEQLRWEVEKSRV